jgi:hypothetical protein
MEMDKKISSRVANLELNLKSAELKKQNKPYSSFSLDINMPIRGEVER